MSCSVEQIWLRVNTRITFRTIVNKIVTLALFLRSLYFGEINILASGLSVATPSCRQEKLGEASSSPSHLGSLAYQPSSSAKPSLGHNYYFFSSFTLLRQIYCADSLHNFNFIQYQVLQAYKSINAISVSKTEIQ